MENPKITFNVRFGADEYFVETHRHEYENLMELLKDKIYPDGFGECGGMGRCGTCLVHLPDENRISKTRIGNEATTLLKMNCEDPNMRLCCQVPIEDTLQNMTISILTGY